MEVVLSGVNEVNLMEEIRTALMSQGPRSIGIACAYLSIFGVERLQQVMCEIPVEECRAVVGIDGHITQPQALADAVQSSWNLRIGKSQDGLFHPKMIVGGSHYDYADTLTEPSFLYLGSGNLTKRGLSKNLELSVILTSEDNLAPFTDSFLQIWRVSEELTSTALAAYSEEYSKVNRNRHLEDILGIDDDPQTINRITVSSLRNEQRQRATAFDHIYAELAWCGLESFTGEYTLQIEFPRNAGLVLQNIIGTGDGNVEMRCDDNRSRGMLYSFYSDNSMFRLNVPNDVPDVEWARENRTGIAVVRRTGQAENPFSFSILRPGEAADDIARRSFLLGTWGKTQTRAFGWF